MKYASVPDGILIHGLFDISYINRHLSVIFDKIPVSQSTLPYVLPSWAGMAIWVTTPPFLYGLFIGIKRRTTQVLLFGITMIAITIYLFSALKIAALEIPQNLARWVFYLLIALSLINNFKNKLVIACWAAIIPISFIHLTCATSGWPQFGYRFALDYYPFLFLLVTKAIGDKVKWHHILLIILAIIINLAGVLWINKFRWVTW